MLFVQTATAVALVGGDGVRYVVAILIAPGIGVRFIQQWIGEARPA